MYEKGYDYDYESSNYDWSSDRKDKCCGGKKNRKAKHYKNCVKDVLEAILYAQNKAEDGCCKSSCKQSIDDLLGEKKVCKNTIPFLLYCGCDPFKGTGVTTYSCHPKKEKLKCIHTHVFKIKELEKDCAVLELLFFKSDLKDAGKRKHGYSKNDACSQVDDKDLDDLVGTGICMTVDLSCFCGITCLPAVRLH
ncbi:CotY/CotZ family spore coat protein [Halobacillus litoralis]|uniref:CotY/CotZ family spore coat protein n=1 Tax=Halobacillus litoralis TaxID=45668 RepID=UPI001CFEAB7E|nr:CotY/CotZ family spore coat protein [Halobacillus litoralis]